MNKNYLLLTLLIFQSTFGYCQSPETRSLRDPFTLPANPCLESGATQQDWLLLGTIGNKDRRTAWLKNEVNWYSIQKGDRLPNSFWHVAKIQNHSVQLNPVLAQTTQCNPETMLEISFTPQLTE